MVGGTVVVGASVVVGGTVVVVVVVVVTTVVDVVVAGTAATVVVDAAAPLTAVVCLSVVATTTGSGDASCPSSLGDDATADTPTTAMSPTCGPTPNRQLLVRSAPPTCRWCDRCHRNLGCSTNLGEDPSYSCPSEPDGVRRQPSRQSTTHSGPAPARSVTIGSQYGRYLTIGLAFWRRTGVTLANDEVEEESDMKLMALRYAETASHVALGSSNARRPGMTRTRRP